MTISLKHKLKPAVNQAWSKVENRGTQNVELVNNEVGFSDAELDQHNEVVREFDSVFQLNHYFMRAREVHSTRSLAAGASCSG